MGFCRRCGEIVPEFAARCKCGGSAVAPVVHWNHSNQRDGGGLDRWAQIYVSNTAARQHAPKQANKNEIEPPANVETIEQHDDDNQRPVRSLQRFPRPLGVITSPGLSLTDGRVPRHTAVDTTKRTPSPTKQNPPFFVGCPPGSADVDVVILPDNDTLSKAYGSILQRPDTLSIHACTRCSSIFPPDATIYPDPQASTEIGPRFLCRQCFATHGGSKGICIGCSREVLTATKKPGFIKSNGKVWHKQCFRCESCDKEIGQTPMVDLFGNPSCLDCFSSCLNRGRTHKNKKSLEPTNTLGGMTGRSDEYSLAVEELSENIGITRRVLPETKRNTPRIPNVSPYPVHLSTRHPDDVSDQQQRPITESMRLDTPPHGAKTCKLSHNHPTPLGQTITSSVTLNGPPTPDLASSSSCSDSLSSCALSTPSNSPHQSSVTSGSRNNITLRATSPLTPSHIVTTSETKCNRCLLSLVSDSGGGQVVTAPADCTGFRPSYHASCFRCFVCGDILDDHAQGHALFVKDPRGVCHLDCTTTDHYIQSISRLSSTHASGCIPEQLQKCASPMAGLSPRFGDSEACPGCRKSVSIMEYGVVPGPQSSRWHVSCLVCGGKGAKAPRPGCGKQLDSAAKTDRDGGVWCRECMILLPVSSCSSPQGSPMRGRLTPSYTGTAFELPRPTAGKLLNQVTGNAFGLTADVLTGQYTGDSVGFMRRGSMSPIRRVTRSVSPTKGLMPVTRHSRPVGSWKYKSVDEGRGMFLVRQMTGNGQS